MDAIRTARKDAKVTVAMAVGLALLPHTALAKVGVVTTTTDLAALATAVGGEFVAVESLTKGTQDPHEVRGKPSDRLKLNRADLFIEVGLHLEDLWYSHLLPDANNPRILPGEPGFLDASEGCDILQKPSTPSRAVAYLHPAGNPHYWLDPENGRVMARAVAARLAVIDPVHAADYDANLRRFEADLTQKEKAWAAASTSLRGLKVATYRSSWANFAKAFGLEVAEVIEPRPGLSPSSARLRETGERMKTEGVRLLIVEPYFKGAVPQEFVTRSGAKLVVLSPSVGAMPGVDGYFDLFDADLRVLQEASR